MRYCWRDDERCVGSAERRDVRTGLGGSAGAALEPTEEVITVSLGGICRETVGLGGNDGLCVWVCDCDCGCDCLDNSRGKLTSLLSLGGFPRWLYPLHTFHARYPISANDNMVTLMVDSVDSFVGMITCELVLWLQ